MAVIHSTKLLVGLILTIGASTAIDSDTTCKTGDADVGGVTNHATPSGRELDGDVASFLQVRLEETRKSEASISQMANALVSRLEDEAKRVVAKFERLGYSTNDWMAKLKSRFAKLTLSEIESSARSAGDTTTPQCVAIKGAAASYRFGAHGEMMAGAAAAEDLENEGFNFVRGFNVSAELSKDGYEDWDYMGWWEKGGDCMITFQGSSNNADFVNNWDPTPVTWMGLDSVHRGLTTELNALVEQIDFAAMKEKCTGTLTATGHSLGGGLAQLFSAAMNHPNDELGADLHVDAVYTFGAMPVAHESLANGVDGCFQGGLFFTAQKNETTGKIGVDIVANTNVGGTTKEFDPIKSDKILLFGPGVEDTYECGNKLPIADLEDTGFSLHLIQMYEFYMQCISYSEFMAFMTALTSH